MLPDTEDKTYARAAAELIAKHDERAAADRRGTEGREGGGGGVRGESGVT